MNRIVRGWAATWLAEAKGARPPRWTLPLRPLGAAVARVVARRGARFERGDGVIRPVLPVISVGNLTVGGTNKTPTVDWLLDNLDESAAALGVVTRGYGRSGPPRTFRQADLWATASPDLREHGDAGLADLGDEPRLLGSHHPDVWIAIDSDRVRGVASLAIRGVQLVIADDAFQHRRLGRSFDLVLVDVTCPWGNGRVLPAGILREPVSGLARADAVLLTRTHEVSAAEIDAVRDVVERWVPREHIHPARLERLGWVRVWEESTPGRSGHSGQVGMDAVGGDADEAGTAAANGEVDDVRRATGNGRAFVITGIAQPESLLRTVVADGLEVCGHRVFRDHERIDRARFREVLAEARRVRAGLLICSEKDLANLPGGASRELPLWYPRVGMSIERGEVLLERIRGAMVAPECLSPLIAPQSTA